MKRVKVEFTEIVERVTMVEVPNNVHVGNINEYIENYINGHVDDSYEWAISDIIKDETVINNILIEDLKL